MGGTSHKGLRPFFMEGNDPLTHQVKIFVISGGLGWMKWLQNGAEKGFIFHAIIPAYILLD